jgi:hypothetical protein
LAVSKIMFMPSFYVFVCTGLSWNFKFFKLKEYLILFEIFLSVQYNSVVLIIVWHLLEKKLVQDKLYLFWR